MKTSSVESQAVIARAGTVARDCLAPGQRGKVLAVFSKTIYLLTDDDELSWMATDDSSMHRRCAVVSSPLPGPSAGSLFRVEDRCLAIDPGFIFDIQNLSLWSAPRVVPGHVLGIIELPARVHALFRNLDPSQAKGFGSFIPLILSLSQNESIGPASESSDPVLRFAQPLVLDMARACLESQPSRLSQIADQLIGLGAGLTPSGDDFLGGFLFAVNQLQAAYPGFGFPNSMIPIESFRSRTHSISFTLLKDHVNGHSIEPLHRILNGIISDESFESIHPFILRLTQIGHSTGWDLLAGLLTGLLIA